MSHSSRLILVVDDEEDAYVAARSLLAEAGAYEALWARSAVEAQSMVALQRFDAALLDFRLAGERGPDVLRALRAAGFTGPAIMFTAFDDPAHDDAAIQAGATACLVKTETTPAALDRMIRYAIASQSAVRDAEAIAHRERVAALTDPLTGLGNRRRFEEDLAGLIDDPDIALVVVDVDGLKSINDALGHGAGDRALRAIAARIRALFRSTDEAYRIGGDEFVLILRPGSDAALRGRLPTEIAAMDPLVGEVRASVGMSRVRGCETLEEALERADRALYDAKRLDCRPPHGLARAPSGLPA